MLPSAGFSVEPLESEDGVESEAGSDKRRRRIPLQAGRVAGAWEKNERRMEGLPASSWILPSFDVRWRVLQVKCEKGANLMKMDKRIKMDFWRGREWEREKERSRVKADNSGGAEVAGS